jgi:hypothetical protein
MSQENPRPPDVRKRIARHVRIRASDLVPHELNPRRHPAAQRQALADLYAEVGFARSLLAYELPDGRLKLIDGHLRQEMSPDMEVDVEVLDVTDEEARKLLLSIDPLAALAEHDAGTLEQLRQITDTRSDALGNLWRSINAASAALEDDLEKARQRKPAAPPAVVEQYLILVECADEPTQLKLLERFAAEGLSCRALLS